MAGPGADRHLRPHPVGGGGRHLLGGARQATCGAGSPAPRLERAHRELDHRECHARSRMGRPTDLDGDAVAADPNRLAGGLDVDTVGTVTGAALAALATTAGTRLFESKDGVVIRATSQDVALANGDTLASTLVTVQD